MVSGFALGLLLVFLLSSPIVLGFFLYSFGVVAQLCYMTRYGKVSDKLWHTLYVILKKYVLICFCTIWLIFVYLFAGNLYWSIKTAGSVG